MLLTCTGPNTGFVYSSNLNGCRFSTLLFNRDQVILDGNRGCGDVTLGGDGHAGDVMAVKWEGEREVE